MVIGSGIVFTLYFCNLFLIAFLFFTISSPVFSLIKLVIFAASSCNSYTKTFGGIDGAGKRLADEVSTSVSFSPYMCARALWFNFLRGITIGSKNLALPNKIECNQMKEAKTVKDGVAGLTEKL